VRLIGLAVLTVRIRGGEDDYASGAFTDLAPQCQRPPELDPDDVVNFDQTSIPGLAYKQRKDRSGSPQRSASLSARSSRTGGSRMTACLGGVAQPTRSSAMPEGLSSGRTSS
jgi:hypothetical protein